MGAAATTMFHKGLIAPVAAGCCLAAGASYIAVANPGTDSAFIPCPFRSLTGMWCPGCGLTRATASLSQGDLGQALRFNALVFAALAAVIVAWSLWFWQEFTKRRLQLLPDRLRPLVASITVAVLLGFGVLRNLPGFDALRG
jgi:hypothetical protein